MKHVYKLSKVLKLVLFIILATLPSIISSILYPLVYCKRTTQTLCSYLNTSTQYYGDSFVASTKQFNYDCSLLLGRTEVYSLDQLALHKLIGEFMFYHPIVSNVYIVDISDNLLYGVDNNKLLTLDYRSHIEKAFEGIPSHYTTFINNEPFLQSAFPITNIDTTVGALVMTYNSNLLKLQLQELTSYSPAIAFYLVDKNGYILLTSQTPSRSTIIPSIDIDRIRQSIDYKPLSTFSLEPPTQCYGSYYAMKDSEWTLLITSPKPSFISGFFVFPLICSSLSLVIIIIIFLKYKKNPIKSHHYDKCNWT